MTFEEWKIKYIKGQDLHIDEDMAVKMYNAAYDLGYDEAIEDNINDNNIMNSFKKLRKDLGLKDDI